MTAATHTAYLLASAGTSTTHAITAGAALPGDFATAACGTYAEAGRTPLVDLTAAELAASPTFCRRCAKAITATWNQDDLDGYTVSQVIVDADGGPQTIADFALAVEHAAHVHAGDGRLF